MLTNPESELDDLFRRYRTACPEVEPSVDFMPALWQKIEARQSFWLTFQRLARTAATACAAVCLLLLVLNFVAPSARRSVLSSETYADALISDRGVEKADYTEALAAVPLTLAHSDIRY